MRNILSAVILFQLLIPAVKNTATPTPTGFTQPHSFPCTQPGWFPSGFDLKDHTLFWYQGYYYLASILLPAEATFAYARSHDLCTWEELSTVLNTGIHGKWDAHAIWAPHVYEENGVFYMYYTGVSSDYAQSILLATSTDPADPASWQVREIVFQPSHDGMLWSDGGWADCRDPTIVKVSDVYYLYYTGLDQSGGIIGVATASSPYGPWTDWGAVMPSEPGAMLESPSIAQVDNTYYLFYHPSGQGEYYRIGASPAGPWQEPASLRPGWAHEIYHSPGGAWLAAYVDNYDIRISALTWNDCLYPLRPVLAEATWCLQLPLIYQRASPHPSLLTH